MLCRKKERLRAKYKITKNPDHYQKYSNCRKDLQNLIQEKMRSNLDDEDGDPAIISKKFWSHVKATSNSSRIPETVIIIIIISILYLQQHFTIILYNRNSAHVCMDT